MIDIFNNEQTVKIQNRDWDRKPEFATQPTWYIDGFEKRVKVGKRTFNCIDYLEAWCGLDQNTHRSLRALKTIESDIKKAFAEVETYKREQKLLAKRNANA